jgi:hypothetical protein
VTFQLAQIVAQLVQTIRWFGKTEGGADGLVDFLRGPAAVVIALSMYDMTNVYGDLGFWFMARARMLIGVGLPLIFVPIMAASYDGIPPSMTDLASALINAARNTGLDRRLHRVQRAEAS